MPIIASRGAGSAGGFGQRNAGWPVEYPFDMEYLVVAGGGGSDGTGDAGGGGAGGYRNSYASETSGANSGTETPLTISEKQTLTITVGAGIAGASWTNGEDSVISGSGITDVTSLGGGHGSSHASAGDGGSGGGCADVSRSCVVGPGTAGQGMSGAVGTNAANATSAGGGGGASASGTTGGHPSGGNGGNGLSSSIDTVSTTRAGGGGGEGTGSNSGGAGGGGAEDNDGTVNTGGGGGGGDAGAHASDSTAGGSGVVILRLPDESYSEKTTGSPTVITGQGAGNDETIITFTGDGTYEA